MDELVNVDNTKVFEFRDQQVRIVQIKGQPYFVGKDVAVVLGYASPRSAISKNVPNKYKGVATLETPSGAQEMTIISEPGIYKLAFKSHAKNAEEFTDRYLTGKTWTLDKFRKECCGNKAKEWVTLYILSEFADEIDYRQPGGWLVPSKGRGNAWIIRAKQACEWMDKNFTRIEWERKLER